jgi:diguanylate cyclase (GGDEF)-like protein
MEKRLSDVLSEFARTLVTDFPIQGILDHLVTRIVEVLPVSAAGVTLIAPGADPRYVAASDHSALRFEALQTELGEGPCLKAYETGEAVSIPNLADTDEFPEFAPRALAEGLVAVFTFPLRQDDHQLGALDLYRTTAGGMSPEEMEAAQTLADVAAAYVLNARAREDLQSATERSHDIAMHDALTGLPNRSLLVQRLDHAIQRCRRSGKQVAILFADLDHFKAINDSFGHHSGDELLVAVADRLRGLVRPGDTLARFAGDEFVILCEDIDDAAEVEPVASRIDHALSEPFVLSAATVRISASIGVAFAGRGVEVPAQVLQEADTAMYQAKRRGGHQYGGLDLREQRRASNTAGLSRDLPDALRREELRVEYQPIVAVADGRIAGVEALIRWTHPTLGAIPPHTVVAIAEQTGVIVQVGSWVLEKACRDIHRLQRHGRQPPLRMAVNVSPHQLMTAGFVDLVDRVLIQTDTDPGRLTLEVTETVFITDSERALVVLNDLKGLGVKIALDDFGTGYSSLSYLKGFPVDIVKVDQSFISNLNRDQTSRHIVRAVVGLAHDLGMAVTAEGVETPSQYAEVVALHCDFYQGFHFAPPGTPRDLGRLLGHRDDDSHPLPSSVGG